MSSETNPPWQQRAQAAIEGEITVSVAVLTAAETRDAFHS
jgi:hypothetical protein